MRISRRGLLLSLLGALGVLLAAVGVRLRLARPEDTVIAILKRRVGHLNVSRESFETFAGPYLERKADYRRQLGLLATFAPLLSVWSPYRWLSMEHPLRKLEDNVVSNYLQSTDFFEHGADEGRVIQYTGFFMVGDARCPNPFATNYYSSRPG